uniref:Uncharacterized protein n=1 Tax=Poecilia latipinna TaxID=48699 RepID=A0A3B3UDR0_9TELE
MEFHSHMCTTDLTANSSDLPDITDPQRRECDWRVKVQINTVQQGSGGGVTIKAFPNPGYRKYSLPKNLSVYSEFVPNTANQVYGSRQVMPHGKEMIKQHGLPLFHGSYRGKKKTVEKET